MAILSLQRQRSHAPEDPRSMGSASSQSARTLDFLQGVLCGLHPRDFAVRCWDGQVWQAEAGCETKFTLVLNHPRALRNLFLRPNQATVAQAFVAQDCDVEGDLEAATTLGRYLSTRRWKFRDLLRYGRWLHELAKGELAEHGYPSAELQGTVHSKERDRQAISYHYDLSNEFYALWLDRRMVYSCGYFLHADEDLDSAQLNKLDYICRKLRLRPGDRLLDIGCGWGGLILHAAERYGVQAVGITLSTSQAEYVSAKVQERDLAARCRVELQDYRDLPSEWEFDKIVSIGMVEHVGHRRLPAYFDAIWRVLCPGGVFLNHGIASRAGKLGERSEFLDQYVFPDSQLIPLDTTVCEAERVGFLVRDVESLREHYTLTLRHWVRRLESHHDEAVGLVGEQAYRVWRLYMAACADSFRIGRCDLYQTLLSKPVAGDSRVPLTRQDWYRSVATDSVLSSS
ncbi:cyclopropane-fatty-acyl-phospholipid synthase [Nitrospira sp.]|nr:cyclopropane-fatty-acyl-phospholipid synthase [Nitrospira sp.]